MALYVGEAVTVIAQALDPVHGDVSITDADAQVEIFAPGKDPKTVPGDRTPDDSFPMTYDAEVKNKKGPDGAYVATFDTEGFAPGRWTTRVVLTGTYDSWEYGSFTLAE